MKRNGAPSLCFPSSNHRKEVGLISPTLVEWYYRQEGEQEWALRLSPPTSWGTKATSIKCLHSIQLSLVRSMCSYSGEDQEKKRNQRSGATLTSGGNLTCSNQVAMHEMKHNLAGKCGSCVLVKEPPHCRIKIISRFAQCSSVKIIEW